ncbi:winged helix-turn-helix domain-containing protein [Tistrella mobilis]|uniref:winged helix-turn-helix domain-containing protein n=1 Tax=Tistrella mobilis TaxID=171437 RepID=UPI00355895F0
MQASAPRYIRRDNKQSKGRGWRRTIRRAGWIGGRGVTLRHNGAALPSEPRDRVAVLSEDIGEARRIADYLKTAGLISVALIANRASCDQLAERPVDLVVLDCDGRTVDGLALGRRILAQGQPGLVFVSKRDDEVERVIGLDMGADDFLVRPFSLRELTARVRAVLRRRRMMPETIGADVRHVRGWTIDLTRREIADPDGEVVRLTRGEFDLLAAIVQAGGRPVTREYLLEVVSKRADAVSDRTVVTLISRLRRKLDRGAGDLDLIRTEPGVGYRITAD